jgi:hypothetical protein
MSSIVEKIKQYVEATKPFVYILTPTYGSMCYVNYTICLIETIKLLKQYNIEVQVEFCRNDSLIPRARNNLLARAMSNPKMTHVLYIDTDITWKPVDIIRLLLSDKRIVGGVYPLKKIEWDRLKQPNIVDSWTSKKDRHEILKNTSDQVLIENHMLNYNINRLTTGNIEVKNNLIEIKHLATGFMMLQRKMVECMQKAFPSTKYTDDVNFLKPHENEQAYALFDCAVVDEKYLSEDWLFCQRWSNMGGQIYADISIDLMHTGLHDFKGSLLTAISS